MGIENFFSDKLTSIPGIGSMFDDSEEKMLGEMAKKRALYERLQLPDSTWEDITPEQLKSLESLTPENINYQTMNEDPRLLSQQRAYLSKLQALGDEGLSAEDKLGFELAARQAGSDAQSRRASAMQDARARGVSGGGMEAALMEMGNQAATDRQSLEGMQQAANAAKQRALYTQAYGDELSGQRDQGYRAEAANKDIINRFNQLNAQNRNTAQQYNVGNRNQLAANNVAERNRYALENRGARNDLAQQGFANQMAKNTGLAGGYDALANFFGAQGERRTKKREATGAAIGSAVGAIYGGPAGAQAGGGIGGAIS
jgi:hypothetical protein